MNKSTLTAHIPACSVNSWLFLKTSGSAWDQTLSLSLSLRSNTFTFTEIKHFQENQQWNLFIAGMSIIGIVTEGLKHWRNGRHLRQNILNISSQITLPDDRPWCCDVLLQSWDEVLRKQKAFWKIKWRQLKWRLKTFGNVLIQDILYKAAVLIGLITWETKLESGWGGSRQGPHLWTSKSKWVGEPD